MAKKNPTKAAARKQPAAPKAQPPVTRTPTRKLALAMVLGCLAAIFITSMIYRMGQPLTTHREVVPTDHDHSAEAPAPQAGQAGQAMPENMPPAMREALAQQQAQGGGVPMGQDVGQGQDMEQVRALMLRMRENPNDPQTLLALGEAFLQSGDQAGAEEFLNRALVADPANLQAALLLGVTRSRAGQHQQAADLFERVLELDADNATAAYNLGMLRKFFLNDPEQGDALLEQAATLAGEDARIGTMAREGLARDPQDMPAPDHDHTEDANATNGSASCCPANATAGAS